MALNDRLDSFLHGLQGPEHAEERVPRSEFEEMQMRNEKLSRMLDTLNRDMNTAPASSPFAEKEAMAATRRPQRSPASNKKNKRPRPQSSPPARNVSFGGTSPSSRGHSASPPQRGSARGAYIPQEQKAPVLADDPEAIEAAEAAATAIAGREAPQGNTRVEPDDTVYDLHRALHSRKALQSIVGQLGGLLQQVSLEASTGQSSKLQRLERDNGALGEKVSSLIAEKKANTALVAELQTKKQRASERYLTYEAEQAELERQSEEQARRVVEQTALLDEQERQLRESREQVAALEFEKTTLLHQFHQSRSEMKAERQSLREQVDRLREDHEGAVKSSEVQKAFLEGQFEQLQLDFEAMKVDRQRVEAEKAENEAKRIALEKELLLLQHEREEEQANLEHQVHDLERVNDAVMDDHEAYKAGTRETVGALEREVDEGREENTALRAENTALRATSAD